MPNKPTLVLVPGAWHSIETWDKIIKLLEAQQYKCVAVALPSTEGNISTTFGQDVKAVRDAIVAETTKGHDVVLIVHSYGGAVGQSAIKGLARPKDRAPSSSGHIIGMTMMASGFGQTGTGFLEGMGGTPPPSWKLDPSGLATIVAPARELFYHDLPEEEGNYWVSKLTTQAQKVFTDGGEDSYAGWKDVPVWFLATTEDKALPIEAQKYFVQLAKDAGANVTAREIASSHSPMLSRPKETVEFITEAVDAFVGK